MGLGKTLQALAHLSTCSRRRQEADAADSPNRLLTSAATLPHLIVCPTSLVFNWVAEAKKFTPELKVLALHGPDRHKLFDQTSTSDIVVTSYALIRRDAEKYR